jgi:FO synthase
LPGTSAEILDDTVRHKIAGGRLSTAQWVEVVTTAHELGLRSKYYIVNC